MKQWCSNWHVRKHFKHYFSHVCVRCRTNWIFQLFRMRINQTELLLFFKISEFFFLPNELFFWRQIHHFDRLVRMISWELKEIKKKVTKVCSKKSYQKRSEAAAHESKIFWKRMFDLKAAPKGQVKLSSFFFYCSLWSLFSLILIVLKNSF